MKPGNFFAELKRRNVYKVAAAYAVVAWLLIQLASILFPTFEAPGWVMKVFVALVALGFPLALIFAWAFELTPEGIKRTEDVAPNESISRRTGRKLAAGIAVVVALAAGLLVFQVVRSQSPRPDSRATAIPDKSIAVLPFENLSDDKSNAYFADGIQDEILTKLANISDLKVVSRTSTAKYKSKPEDLKTVSQQLGVATVLDGSVQKAGDRVRVNVQLIDARADTHLWAKSYDGDAKDIFGVQTEVSQQVADALRAKLSPAETNALAAAPTQDTEAYDLFLKGEYALRHAETVLTAEAFDAADAAYRRALQRDPNFALAAARLAESRVARHWYVTPLTSAELNEAKSLAERAVRLAPNVAGSHMGMGLYYYWGRREYEAALAEFRRAIELQPNNSSARKYLAYVYRRQGRWEPSLTEMTKAAELDPRDADIPANISFTYVSLRQWNEAKRAGARAVSIDPQNKPAMQAVSSLALNGDGDIDAAKRALAPIAPGPVPLNLTRGLAMNIVDQRPYFRVLERDFAGALQDWEKQEAGAGAEMTRLSARVVIRIVAGDAAGARPEAEEARPLLEAWLQERPDDGAAMMQLSWIYLALGRNPDALSLARRAAASLPVERDAHAGPAFATGLAQIQAHAGEEREAVKALRHLLAIPAGMAITQKLLQIDPVWDPIRNDPEFQQLLAGKEQIGPVK